MHGILENGLRVCIQKHAAKNLAGRAALTDFIVKGHGAFVVGDDNFTVSIRIGGNGPGDGLGTGAVKGCGMIGLVKFEAGFSRNIAAERHFGPALRRAKLNGLGVYVAGYF